MLNDMRVKVAAINEKCSLLVGNTISFIYIWNLHTGALVCTISVGYNHRISFFVR